MNIFTDDIKSTKEGILVEKKPIGEVAGIISSEADEEAVKKGDLFAKEIKERFVSDFEKSEKLYKDGKVDKMDHMAHVSTFLVTNDTIFMSYYVNTSESKEDPNFQTARIAYCPVDNPDNKTFLDIQSVGDFVCGKEVKKVYDTILMQKDEDTIFVMWTASVEDNYYRFFRTFSISEKKLGDVMVNKFKVGDITNDFSVSGMENALAQNGIEYKWMWCDTGIMQKISTRMEDGKLYYYTGAYNGDFTCIIKSCDLITWEYVSTPDFDNESVYENATYVLGDKCFYFVRQREEDSKYGFLTTYDLITKKWALPVLIEDCQSRSDFIVYDGELYLFHAPIDREHIGIVKIDTENIKNSKVILQADMKSSCFYPFVQYFDKDTLAMSYTVERKHIRLAMFDMKKYI